MKLPDVQAPSGSGHFLRLKDKETVRGVFVGDVHHFYTKWKNGKSLPCDEKDPEGNPRFKCNFVYHDETQGQLVVKVWEFAYAVFEILKGINEDYPLEKTKLKITRNGTGTNTTYMVLPLVGEKEALTANQIAAINNMPLHDLKKKEKGSQGGDTPMPSADDEIPF